MEEPSSPTSRKRRRADAPSERRGVAFSHVAVRSHRRELWGGGGVPGDDGPPLGLSWHVLAEDSFPLDAYEGERERNGRTPKDQYCFTGSVQPEARRRMLQRCGSTEKEMRTATRGVSKLNRERIESSAMLMGNAWLFASSMEHDTEETLSMLGMPDAYGVRLCARDWHDAASFAKALARPLNLAPERLLHRNGKGGGVAWPEVQRALQGWMARGHTALLVDCDAPPSALATAAATPPRRGARRADAAKASPTADADDVPPTPIVAGAPPPGTFGEPPSPIGSPVGALILDAEAVETDAEGADADDEVEDGEEDCEEEEDDDELDEYAPRVGSGGFFDPSSPFASPRASEEPPLGLEYGSTAATLLGRLVASVSGAYAMYHATATEPVGGSLSVVLRGWRSTQLTAEWSDDEPDEMTVGLLN